jgi:glutathione S-transferase
MAIAASQQQVHLREIELRHKPVEFLNCSAKGTVPVVQLQNKKVLDESLDIMHWALQIHDPLNWLVSANDDLTDALVKENDFEFKQQLDHYKYADRFPENSPEQYRQQASLFPERLDDMLQKSPFLLSNQPTLADIAIFPFIRQFAFVDKQWFDTMPWSSLQSWLDSFLEDPLFKQVMIKYPPWKAADVDITVFP